MADRDFIVRVILEGKDALSRPLNAAIGGATKDINKLRGSLKDLKKDADQTFAGFGGTTVGRGPGGRFVALQKDIDGATSSLQRFREEARKTLAQGNIGQALGGFREGLGREVEIRKEIDRRINLSKEEKDQELAIFNEKVATEKNLRDEQFRKDTQHFRNRQTQERIAAAAAIRDQRLISNAIQDRINLNRKALSEMGFNEEQIAENKTIKVLREKRDAIEAIIQRRIDARNQALKSIDDEIAAERRLLHAQFDNDIRRRRQEIVGRRSPVVIAEDVRREFDAKGLEGDIDRVDNRFRRLGATAGRALGQVGVGFRIARDGLTQNEKQFLRTTTAATRFGASIGNITRNISPFRGRILALIAVLQILGTLFVQFGAALVSIASSAILAAGALGGALLASLTQLAPIVGLLVASFSRLGAVLDAAKLADKLKLTRGEDEKNRLDSLRDATQRLSDARYNSVKAAEAVKDAEFELAQSHKDVKNALDDQREAIKDLAEARRDAARAIVDANLEERDAALSLAEANLAVLEAKKRLKEQESRSQLDEQNLSDARAAVTEARARLEQVRKEGDQAEISNAAAGVSEAEQRLNELVNATQQTKNDIEENKLAVRRAELAQEQAENRNKRAKQDAAETRRKGIEGSDEVQAAQEAIVRANENVERSRRQQVLATRALRDAVHAVTIAHREESDAKRNVIDATNKQTAAQENLQQALGDLSPAEKRAFRSIQRIKQIYKDNFRPITDIIVDSFARAIDRAAIILQDPRIIGAATKLATAIGASVENLSKFSISPEFRRFLTFSIKQAADNVPKITEGFIDLTRVLIRVARAATPIFNTLLDRFVNFLDRLERRTRDTSGLDKFFESAGRHLDSWLQFAGAVARILGLVIKFSAPAGRGLLDDLTDKLNEWSDWLDTHGDEVREFFVRIRVQVGALAGVLGKVAVLLFTAFSSESAGHLTTFILNTVIPAFALFLQILGGIAFLFNQLAQIPLIGPLAQNTLKFGIALILVVKVAKTLTPLVLVLGNAFSILFRIMTSSVVVGILSKALGLLVLAIKAVGIALRFVFITNPWIGIIVAIIAAVVLLDRKFHFIRPTIEAIGKAFRKIFNFIKDHWKLLAAILLGPFGIVLIGIVKWKDKIVGFFKAIVDFVREHWKLLVAIILGPFAIGGAIIIGIIKFHDKIVGFFRGLVSGIVKAFGKLPGELAKIFNKIPGLLKEALKGLAGIVEKGLRAALPGPLERRIFGNSKTPEDEKKIANQDRQRFLNTLPGKARQRAKQLQGKGKTYLEVVNMLIDEGLLNENNRGVLQRLNIVSSNEFAVGGSVPGGEGTPVPIIAHAGEWVLNKSQQMKLAQRLGDSMSEVQAFLFGSRSGAGKPGRKTTGTRPTTREKGYRGAYFNLVPHEDPTSTDSKGDPIILWFLEMDDGAFGQVSPRDAARIKRTKGAWIPGYVKRSSHGYTQKWLPNLPHGLAAGGVVQKFLKGGVVSSNYAMSNIQSFAAGGTVVNSGGVANIQRPNEVHQTFSVQTQGETDWNYVMRLAAIHAQESF